MIKKMNTDDLIVTAWWPMYDFQNKNEVQICNMPAKICTAKRPSFCSTLNALYYNSFIKLFMLVTRNKSFT